jgi:hypothetical protein
MIALAVLVPAWAGARTAARCSCDEAPSPRAFRTCVRTALTRLTRTERHAAPSRLLRRRAARAACGRTSAPQKAVTCCLPGPSGQEIVTERMCGTITARRCAALGGTAVGAGVACAPNPCRTLAGDIPVAHTPPGGYGRQFPAPVLAGCTEPLVAGAPDLRAMWQTESVEVGGAPAPPDHPAYRHVERIEQCGDRLVVTGGGVIHDMRCDGTEEHGVHDVAGADFTTPITVVATYENGVHTLRPVGISGIEVTRRLDGDALIWTYVSFTARLRRVGGPESAPPPEP